MHPVIKQLQSIPAAMKALDQLETDIRQAPTFAALKGLAQDARDIQRRWRPVKEVADKAGQCWVAADYKLGEELLKNGKSKGTKGQIVGRKPGSGGRGKNANLSSGGTIMSAPDEVQTDADLGIGKRLAARARKLAELDGRSRQQLVKELKSLDRAVTPDAVLALNRLHNKVERKHQISASKFSNNGPFDAAVIDPPWDMKKIDRDVRPNQDAFDYPTMATDKIAALWRDEIAPRLKPDCHVFLWTTQRYLPDAIALLQSFGLRYVLTFVWHKDGGFQPIDLPQYNCEFVIYARKGTPLFIDTKNFLCCFTAKRREHSRKPDEFYDVIRRVTGGSRIDVFSREKREGFAQYGNQTDTFDKSP